MLRWFIFIFGLYAGRLGSNSHTESQFESETESLSSRWRLRLRLELRLELTLRLTLVLLCRTHFVFDLCSEPFLNNK